ncbi:MAG: HAD family hydrolase [Desmonostoc vinosum HA7617-LM4]|jgi:phosphoglycolate phosphatase-like HAD superfamily hydrolase|nr:HAD family hydrolase [Desmonostoc vinosum HA7617-LM4]
MQLIIFDIDGTLTNTNQIDADCFIQAFDLEFGIADINTNWAEYTYITDSGLAQEIFREKLERVALDEELFRLKRCFVNLLEEVFTNDQDLCKEITGATNLLVELQKLSVWRVAIATAGWGESAKLKLQKAMLPIAGLPLASADDGLSRADTLNAAIFKAKNVYQVDDFEKIVFVGDGVWDV